MAIGYDWVNVASRQIVRSERNVIVSFYIDVKLSSQDTVNNYSVVDTRLRSTTQNGYISGTGYKFTLTGSGGREGSEIWTFDNEIILTGQTTIYHNEDGTKVGSAAAYCYNSYWGISENFNGTFELPTIARASQPTISPSTFNIGDTITINTNRKSTLFTHTLSLSFGSYTYQIGTGVGDSITLDTSTIANNLYQQTPNDSQKNGTITCITYNGSTQIGTKTANFTAVVINSNPTFTPAYQDVNPSTIAITDDNQYIIRNRSYLQISISNASAKNYATLSRFYVSLNGTEYEGEIRGTGGVVDIGTINVSLDINAVVIVEDSRGFTSQVELPITILDWTLPSAIISIQRENNYYTTTNINVDANYSSLNNLNTISIKARYKKTTDSTYGAYITLTDGITSQFTLDNLYSWNVQVLLEDRIGSTTYNLFVDKGLPIIFFDRLNNSVGVECFPTNTNSLEVDGVDVGNKYSTNEIVVGRWIDNKPIYRKVIRVNSLAPSNNYFSVSHGISNFQTLVKLNCIANNSADLFFDFNNYLEDNTGLEVHTFVDNTNIYVYNSGTISYVSDAYFILEYTKTTD